MSPSACVFPSSLAAAFADVSTSRILTYRRVLSDRADHLVSVVLDKSRAGTASVNLSDIISWCVGPFYHDM